MKASYFESFNELDQIKTGELPDPELKEGEVLVRIRAAGVNPVDAAVVRGMLKDAIPTEFPVIPGWDLAGEVEKRGFSARRFSEGDEVYAYARRPVIQHGTFAEYISIPESYLSKKPESITMEQAGGIPLVGLTAYQSLFDAGNLREGQTVLILGGSGGVGTLAIQLAKSVDAKVIGVASEKNHAYMKELGADETIDYSDGNVGEAVRKLHPDGVDMIFHCSRGDSLSQSMGTLKKGGHLVSITKSKPEVRDDIHFQYVFVEPNARQLDHIRELVDSGKITVPVSETFTLEEVPQALSQIEKLHTRGKLVVTP
ncbi:NADP-dependent oxidoreductase [Rhodohalobacter sp. SW132]|uniref:NADP-dependent oxidoreductase n=1 Tax=Rhodohalobacter sp. SW132 TaxID=2293433 RepID=UPI0018F775B0|nr:NADP-dependent oxidoreductase [Rhodohalobacter sp. SW132]